MSKHPIPRKLNFTTETGREVHVCIEHDGVSFHHEQADGKPVGEGTWAVLHLTDWRARDVAEAILEHLNRNSQ